MKNFSVIVFLTLLLCSSLAFAHTGGHGKVNQEKAVEIAQNAAKMLTFKSYGMAIGKIDSSWASVKKASYQVVKEGDDSYIIEATNDEKSQTLYFDIGKNGEINAVKDAVDFTKKHDHSH
ncbi:DUF6488 family protein [Litorilituus lipolyticus]|uniref:PepSY domain-containing protein n=1 Tax=Litorilituus lipolyticus TaxID=2491017 RepID=A0A502LHP1_9GAMM|nr:DUF6488 family protein [Litorilituus lipolyticus]TPH19277.1 hypothetical protein EPA86_00695 [Litorilituus lipolyticus]